MIVGALSTFQCASKSYSASGNVQWPEEGGGTNRPVSFLPKWLISVPDNRGKGLVGSIQFTQSSPWSSVAGPPGGERKNPCLI